MKILVICSQNAKCAYCLVIPLLLYATQSAPKPVSALFYIVNLPLLGLMSPDLVANQYLSTDVVLVVLLLFLVVTINSWTKLVPRVAYAICARYGLRRRQLFLLLCTGSFVGAVLFSDTLVSVPVLFIVDRAFSTLYKQNLDVSSGAGQSPKQEDVSGGAEPESAVMDKVAWGTRSFAICGSGPTVSSEEPRGKRAEENQKDVNPNRGGLPRI
ncbi:unnamed protein product [Ixodes hexagonus]